MKIFRLHNVFIGLLAIKKRNALVFRTLLFLFSRTFLFYFFRITNDFSGTEAAIAPSVGVPLETSTDFA